MAVHRTQRNDRRASDEKNIILANIRTTFNCVLILWNEINIYFDKIITLHE